MLGRLTKNQHRSVHLVIGLSLLVVLGACRSQLDVQTKGTFASAAAGATKPPVVETAGITVDGPQIYFQTRDAITVEIDSSVLEGAPSFTLLNTTQSGDDDSKATTILQEAVPTLGLVDKGFYSLDASTGNKTTLSFYPFSNTWQGKFFYGLNTLKVVADDPANSRTASIQLTLEDFTIFDLSVLGFADQKEVETLPNNGGYFEGWVNVLGPAQAAATDGSTLTAGVFDIINNQ